MCSFLYVNCVLCTGIKLSCKWYGHFIIAGKTGVQGGLPKQAGDWRTANIARQRNLKNVHEQVLFLKDQKTVQ